MIVFPSCKINLGLYITGKRQDGYHSLESVFLKVPLNDILEVTENAVVGEAGYSFESSGMPVPGDPESNLVVKAYQLLREKHPLPPVRIFLHKVIPMGAGLGGGSSDGAFMLTLLNRKFELGITEDALFEYAAALGSDCPFFIKDKTSYVTGRGEVLEEFGPELKDHYCMLVNPGIHVSTAEAFRMVKPVAGRTEIRKILKKEIGNWKNELINDFEEPVSSVYPQIKEIKTQLYASGADYASMTGTGSTVFGLFKEKPQAKNIFPESYFTWSGKLDNR